MSPPYLTRDQSDQFCLISHPIRRLSILQQEPLRSEFARILEHLAPLHHIVNLRHYERVVGNRLTSHLESIIDRLGLLNGRSANE